MTAMKERVHVVLAAGGAGSRMGAGQNKIFLEAGGKSILLRSMQLFEGIIDRMVIVCRPEDEHDHLRKERPEFLGPGLRRRRLYHDDHRDAHRRGCHQRKILHPAQALRTVR